MKLTLRSIAERANVSPATVSNALNGRAGVSKAVQENVLAIAREMGYQPSRERHRTDQHVRLVFYRSHGMVVVDTLFFAELTESIQLECHRMGLEVLISHLDAREAAQCAEQIRSICAEQCAGIILLGTEMSREELHRFDDVHSPLVVLDNIFRFEKVHAVVMNNVEAGYLAARALCETGHRRIDHIVSNVSFSNMEDRTRGMREGLAEYGLGLSDEQIWPVKPTMNGAYEDMRRMLEAGRKLPEAFFAGNDLMAIGAMRAIVEAGYRVPDDVSIIGMDDTAICQACTPQLSTIQVHRHDLGVAAIRTLLNMVDENTQSIIKTEMGVDLVMRGSVCDRKKIR